MIVDLELSDSEPCDSNASTLPIDDRDPGSLYPQHHPASAEENLEDLQDFLEETLPYQGGASHCDNKKLIIATVVAQLSETESSWTRNWMNRNV